MKLYINQGFIIIITLMIMVFISTFNPELSKLVDNFSVGFYTGIILVSGLFMLNHTIVIIWKPKNKRNKFRIKEL